MRVLDSERGEDLTHPLCRHALVGVGDGVDAVAAVPLRGAMIERHMAAVVAAPCRSTTGGAEAGPVTTMCVVPKLVATSRPSNGTGQLRRTVSYCSMNRARACGLRKGSRFATGRW